MKISLWQGGRRSTVTVGTLVLLCSCRSFLGTAPAPVVTYDAASPIEARPVEARPVDYGAPADLPLPGTLSVAAYEAKLFDFLNNREYVKLGWRRDKGVRDTGPFIDGKYYGTHPAVRVYYSPGVMQWLVGGRLGTIADGEMIIKEQYPAPAVRHDGKNEKALWNALESWTVMVKDSAASHDGWFWSNPVKGQCVVDNHQYPYDHPVSGFGLYCVRCHAATISPNEARDRGANEFTFAALRNIAGYPGMPLQFRVDDSWRDEAKKSEAPASEAHPKCARPKAPPPPTHDANGNFLNFFTSIKPAEIEAIAKLPPATHDWVVAHRAPTAEFATSNQCMNCHSGLVAPYGPSMFVATGKSVEYGAPGWNVSPYGEWRWTPMGLAGRDPVFYAQLESEIRLLQTGPKADPKTAGQMCQTLTETCLRCHGAMGKKQFELDHAGERVKFSLEQVHATAKSSQPLGHGDAKYGALARDGISCMVCHRMQPRAQPPEDHRPYLQFFLETSITGNFHTGARGEIYGPYKDDEIAPYAMEHALGHKPKHSAFLKSSQLCGTCHTVSLPTLDKPLDPVEAHHGSDELIKGEVVPAFRKYHHHVEQATYLEWLNSEYENEINKTNPRAQTCQDCHMSRGLKDESHDLNLPEIRTRIAAIQDSTYPEAENLAAGDQLKVRLREEGYRRHNFSGLNAFLVEIFNQFDDVLGVPKTDFMTGSKEDLTHSIDNMVRTARHDVATVEVTATHQGPSRLTAEVVIHNKAGHRFPSGVGFRRAFVELMVVETPNEAGAAERVVWSSGRTNELGVLLGADGKPLATEFFERAPRSEQRFQKHHECITSPDQVQVYETLLRDAEGQFTTSFVRGCETVKDNRLLPRGWKREGPGPALASPYLEATHPDRETAKDPRYGDGSGSDAVTYDIELPTAVDLARLQVRATLYYQSMPPYFLRKLFETAPDGPATRRLHYLCSHLNLKGTPLEDWKLRIGTAACSVK